MLTSLLRNKLKTIRESCVFTQAQARKRGSRLVSEYMFDNINCLFGFDLAKGKIH